MSAPRVRREFQKKQCFLFSPYQVLRASRCAKTTIRTPTGDFGLCGVQKRQFAHRQGISGFAVCKSLDPHTEARISGRAVCKNANSHTGRGFWRRVFDKV